MNCEQVRGLIEKALDDRVELGADARSHMASCGGCRQFARELSGLEKSLGEGARQIIAASPAPDVDAILTSLPDRPASAASTPAPRRRRLYIAIACAAALLLMLNAGRRRNRRTPERVAPLQVTEEHREAARILSQAREELLASLSKPVSVPNPEDETVGKQIVDVPLGSEISGIQASVVSMEAFILEWLPIPTLETGDQGRAPNEPESTALNHKGHKGHKA